MHGPVFQGARAAGPQAEWHIDRFMVNEPLRRRLMLAKRRQPGKEGAFRPTVVKGLIADYRGAVHRTPWPTYCLKKGIYNTFTHSQRSRPDALR